MQFIAKAFLEKDYKAILARKAALLPPKRQLEEDTTSRDVVIGNNEGLSAASAILEPDGIPPAQPNLEPHVSTNGHTTADPPSLQNHKGQPALPQSDNATSNQNRNQSPPSIPTNAPSTFPATDEELHCESMFRDASDGAPSGLTIS